MGRLWLQGANVDFRGLHAGHKPRKVPLPTYRFTIKPDELGVWIDVLKDLGQLSVPVDKAKIVVTAP